jgi:hypothetical protein
MFCRDDSVCVPQRTCACGGTCVALLSMALNAGVIRVAQTSDLTDCVAGLLQKEAALDRGTHAGAQQPNLRAELLWIC